MKTYDVNVPQSLHTNTVEASSITPIVILPSTLSYQFQVVEYMEAGKVVKVELQVQQTEHDNNGIIKSSTGFKPVPRIKLPSV